MNKTDKDGKAVTELLGQRIRLTAIVERFPHFLVKQGATGTVSFVDEKRKQINVKMDALIEGCEEWDNEIIWDGEETEDFPLQTELLKA